MTSPGPTSDEARPRRIVITDREVRSKPRVYNRFVAERAAVIFESALVSDPMETVDGHRPLVLSNKYFQGAPSTGPFTLVPSEFLARARIRRPESPDSNASAFANWVYSLYGKLGADPDLLEQGLAAEGPIYEARASHYQARSILTSCDNALLARQRPDWKLVHCGLHLDPDVLEVPFFEVEELAVGDQPLRASPDLVYRNIRTREVIIVEVKLSRQALPPNLWPNVWAQLWCYAHIPSARDAPKVTVIAEIWGELFKWSRTHQYSMQWVCLRTSVRRNPRAPAYDKFFRTLFDIYRGRAA